MAINVVAAVLLVRAAGFRGLALATSLAALANGGAVCADPFFVQVREREFTRTWTAGGALKVSGSVGIGLAGESGGGISVAVTERADEVIAGLCAMLKRDGPAAAFTAVDVNSVIRVVERISPGYGTFPDIELEEIYADRVRAFTDYQARM